MVFIYEKNSPLKCDYDTFVFFDFCRGLTDQQEVKKLFKTFIEGVEAFLTQQSVLDYSREFRYKNRDKIDVFHQKFVRDNNAFNFANFSTFQEVKGSIKVSNFAIVIDKKPFGPPTIRFSQPILKLFWDLFFQDLVTTGLLPFLRLSRHDVKFQGFEMCVTENVDDEEFTIENAEGVLTAKMAETNRFLKSPLSTDCKISSNELTFTIGDRASNNNYARLCVKKINGVVFTYLEIANKKKDSHATENCPTARLLALDFEGFCKAKIQSVLPFFDNCPFLLSSETNVGDRLLSAMTQFSDVWQKLPLTISEQKVIRNCSDVDKNVTVFLQNSTANKLLYVPCDLIVLKPVFDQVFFLKALAMFQELINHGFFNELVQKKKVFSFKNERQTLQTPISVKSGRRKENQFVEKLLSLTHTGILKCAVTDDAFFILPSLKTKAKRSAFLMEQLKSFHLIFPFISNVKVSVFVPKEKPLKVQRLNVDIEKRQSINVKNGLAPPCLQIAFDLDLKLYFETMVPRPFFQKVSKELGSFLSFDSIFSLSMLNSQAFIFQTSLYYVSLLELTKKEGKRSVYQIYLQGNWKMSLFVFLKELRKYSNSFDSNSTDGSLHLSKIPMHSLKKTKVSTDPKQVATFIQAWESEDFTHSIFQKSKKITPMLYWKWRKK